MTTVKSPMTRRSFALDGSPASIQRAQKEIGWAINYWQCTNREIAEEAGVCEATVWRFYHGLAKQPQFRTLMKVLKAVGWTTIANPGEVKTRLRKVA